MLANLEDIAKDRDVPPNLHSLDAGLLVQQQERAKTQDSPQLSSLQNTLSRIRQGVHDYLVATEAELDAGREESSFFDRHCGFRHLRGRARNSEDCDDSGDGGEACGGEPGCGGGGGGEAGCGGGEACGGGKAAAALKAN
jgi:hypothetical protein